MTEEMRRALEIIYSLTDDNPCELDRHGCCRMHSWSGSGTCPNYLGLELLAEYGMEYK